MAIKCIAPFQHPDTGKMVKVGKVLKGLPAASEFHYIKRALAETVVVKKGKK